MLAALQCGARYCFIFSQHKAIPHAALDLEPELSAKVTLTLGEGLPFFFPSSETVLLNLGWL